jgi:hypothetical protein
MSVETLVVVNFSYQENMIMFSSHASLKSRLAHYCYTPIPSDDNDELIQIFNINRQHCGTLHQECLERWLNHAESWRKRFPEKPLSPTITPLSVLPSKSLAAMPSISQKPSAH